VRRSGGTAVGCRRLSREISRRRLSPFSGRCPADRIGARRERAEREPTVAGLEEAFVRVKSNNTSRRGWQERFKDEFGRSERSRRG
jgi:hypothetical protein